MSNIVNILRSREMGSQYQDFQLKPHDLAYSIVAKQLLITSDVELVIKVYIEIICVQDHEGKKFKFLSWMTNKVIGTMIEFDKDNMKVEELFDIMFTDIGYEMFFCSDHIIMGRNGEGLFTKTDIIRSVIIIVKPSEKEMIIKYYRKLEKPSNMFFYFVETNSSLRWLHRVNWDD